MRESILNPCARVRYRSRGQALSTAIREILSTPRFRFFRRGLCSRFLRRPCLFCSSRRRSYLCGLCGSSLPGLAFAASRRCRSRRDFCLALVFALWLFLFFLLGLVLDSSELLQNLGALNGVAALAFKLRLEEIFQNIV